MNTSAMGNKMRNTQPRRGSIADIDAALRSLWSEFHQDVSGGHTVMRACMSNLIIYCDTKEEAALIGKEIPAIVDIHPARVLLLIGNGQPKKGNAESNVSIYYTELNSGWQVCAERIDAIVTTEAVDRLPSIARSHLIGDLPITLWWASRLPPPDAGDIFFQLAELANQIIYDNMGWANPAKGVASTTRWVAAQQDSKVVHNLAWRRIAGWRKLIGQVLDPQTAPDALNSLNSIEIEHGPHALAMTWVLVGWLASRLQWKAVDGKRLSDSELVWRFQHQQQDIKVVAKRRPEGEPLLYRLLFDWSRAEQPGRICFERLDHDRIGIDETMSTVPPRVFSAQIPSRSALISAQLAHRSREKIFEEALKASNSMSAVFQK
ncbi:glucose-6-phosphate dehydrogenase assembly protein OpcA [Methylomonas sp. SURF-2]|uniref:Glucose-6-phosphate dehydrogenase assembly protein OpcA n=1 Tax=Methylomonas subterranea TaxID=2952225 RepID=A0ABT1TLW4_9GAMM|nr:glucose-6-phosphate dehydrogenase assembly protein OpcA [Methylomonas sp. SURF-2]MCQ8106216.1 glucose-6-phosphate dehydrogenase assembly protein OpcA [Methylomonas sp. SURF-2]